MKKNIIKSVLAGILICIPVLVSAQEKELVISSEYEKDTITIILTNTTNSTMQIYNKEKEKNGSYLSFEYSEYQYNDLTQAMEDKKVGEYKTVFSYPIKYPGVSQWIDAAMIEIEPFKSCIFKFPLHLVGQETNDMNDFSQFKKFWLLQVSCYMHYHIPGREVYSKFAYHNFTFSLNEKSNQVAEPFSTDSIDVPPQFPGGQVELMKYLSKSIRYNGINDIMGRAIVKFIIEKDGSITNIELVRSVDRVLDREAIRVVASMPTKWKPGYKNGTPVRVWYTVPVLFKLQ